MKKEILDVRVKNPGLRKRSFFKITSRQHDQIKELSAANNKSMTGYIEGLCLKMSEGEYQELIEEYDDSKWKSIGIYQDVIKETKKAIEGKKITVLGFLKLVIEEEYKKITK